MLSRPVALKVISTDVEVTDEVRARFFREAQACARLSHPNIVTVYDMGEDDGRLFIVMELLEGVELRRLIADRTPLALEDKLSIMSRSATGSTMPTSRGSSTGTSNPPTSFACERSGEAPRLRHRPDREPSGHAHADRADHGNPPVHGPRAAPWAGRSPDGYLLGGCGLLRVPQPETSVQRQGHAASARPAQERGSYPAATVDPTIPAELSDIVARAMRKDPAGAFRRPETDAAADRVLASDLDGGGGSPRSTDPDAARPARPTPGRPGRPRGICRRGSAYHHGRATAPCCPAGAGSRPCRSNPGRARDAVAGRGPRPRIRAGVRASAGRPIREAITEFEAIVADMPGHARAADGLARAREGPRRSGGAAGRQARTRCACRGSRQRVDAGPGDPPAGGGRSLRPSRLSRKSWRSARRQRQLWRRARRPRSP